MPRDAPAPTPAPATQPPAPPKATTEEQEREQRFVVHEELQNLRRLLATMEEPSSRAMIEDEIAQREAIQRCIAAALGLKTHLIGHPA